MCGGKNHKAGWATSDVSALTDLDPLTIESLTDDDGNQLAPHLAAKIATHRATTTVRQSRTSDTYSLGVWQMGLFEDGQYA